MKTSLSLFLMLSLLACNQQKAAETPKKPSSNVATTKKPETDNQTPNNSINPDATAPSNKPAPEPALDLATLVGNWTTACEPVDLGAQTAISPIKSSKAALSIESATSASLKLTFYTDNKCANVLTQAKATTLLKTYELLTGKKVDTVLVNKLSEIIKGTPIALIYKATAVAPGAVGDIDATVEGKTFYSSYKIVSEKLHIAEVCLSADIIPNVDQNCSPKGESAANRGNNFEKAKIFSRVK